MKSPGLLGQGLLRRSLATPKYFPADGQQPRLGQDNVNRIGRMELVKLGSRSVFRLLLLSLSLTFPLFHQSELILIARQPRHCIGYSIHINSAPSRNMRGRGSCRPRATTRVGAIATSQCSKSHLHCSPRDTCPRTGCTRRASGVSLWRTRGMYSLVSYPLVVLIDSSQDPPCPAGQSCCVKVVGLPDGV
ncbi:hypothetical protein B0H13DRAFT_998821 [Mycena leptocephala]|nr:hypothetical protein B0H13DRAFT_998821 [Mycena leptocephala]